jgi:hypothetical protein
MNPNVVRDEPSFCGGGRQQLHSSPWTCRDRPTVKCSANNVLQMLKCSADTNSFMAVAAREGLCTADAQMFSRQCTADAQMFSRHQQLHGSGCNGGTMYCRCSNAQMFKCSNVQQTMYCRCSNVQQTMYCRCSNVQQTTYCRCSNVQQTMYYYCLDAQQVMYYNVPAFSTRRVANAHVARCM